MPDETLLPPSIRDQRFLALEAILNRIPALDLAILQVYDIDRVAASALYDLADQFNVLGLRGWNLCETEAEKRTLIKNAIVLHKYAGTPWAIRRAIIAVGFKDTVVEENPAFLYDGERNGGITYDGYDSYSGQVWGAFRVFVDPGSKLLTQQQVQLLTSLILEWKNRRSHLLSVGVRRSLLPYNGLPLDTYDGDPTYSGTSRYNRATFFYDGVQQYTGLLIEV